MCPLRALATLVLETALAAPNHGVRPAAVGITSARFVHSLHEWLVGYGAQATASTIDLGGQPVWSVQGTTTGQRTDILVRQLGDTLLVRSEPANMSRLLR